MNPITPNRLRTMKRDLRELEARALQIRRAWAALPRADRRGRRNAAADYADTRRWVAHSRKRIAEAVVEKGAAWSQRGLANVQAANRGQLTVTQQELVDRLQKETVGGRIEYRRGGFWTAPETIANADGVPDWWVTAGTVKALARKGVLVVTARREWGPSEYQLAPEWRGK